MNKSVLIIVSMCLCINAFGQTGSGDNHQPKFINNVVMGSHIKTSSTVVVTDKVALGNDGKNEGVTSLVTSFLPPVSGTPVEVAPAPVAHVAVAAKPVVSNSIIGKYADMVGSGIEEIASHFPLYSFIEDWYGTDYKMGGKDKSGIDCSAFAQKLYEQVFGIDMLRTAFEQFKDCKITHDISKAKEGDLVFFHINSRRITHVGIYLANNYFVHASSANGVVINNLKDKYYQKYLAGIGRLSGK
jgi:hypothetical protein